TCQEALTHRRLLQKRSREPSSTEWRTTKRTFFPIRCRHPWRKAGAAARPRHSSGSTRRSQRPNASSRKQALGTRVSGAGLAMSGRSLGIRIDLTGPQPVCGVVIVCWYHRQLVLDRVKPVQGPKGLRSVFVRESSWVARLLADGFDLVCVPCRVARKQYVAARSVQQHADTARSVACEVDEDNRTVAEEIVTAREGQDRGTVKVILDGCAACKRVANPSDWRDGSCCDPITFGPVQIYRQPGQSSSPHTWSQWAWVGKAKSMSALAYSCSASADTVGTTSAAGRTAALSTAGSCATARTPTLTQTPGSTMNVAVGWVTTKDASEFSIRRGCRRPCTINAVGTERGTCRRG